MAFFIVFASKGLQRRHVSKNCTELARPAGRNDYLVGVFRLTGSYCGLRLIGCDHHPGGEQWWTGPRPSLIVDSGGYGGKWFVFAMAESAVSPAHHRRLVNAGRSTACD